MNRILLIDPDRGAMQKLGLACLEQEIGVVMADNVCEGVRALLADSVSLVLVDHLALRLGARESATLFERVAPNVPVVLVGKDYWTRVIDFAAMSEAGLIQASDLDLFDLVDSAEDAWNALVARGLKAHSPPDSAEPI